MRTRWERRNQWFARTFKPVCTHPPDQLVRSQHYGERRTVCLKCRQVVARELTP